MGIFFNCNEKIYKEGTAVITPDNRCLRYGDGLFENIKTTNGKIQLRDYHFERLFAGMEMLQFTTPKHFTAKYLEDKIAELCKKNQHNSFARPISPSLLPSIFSPSACFHLCILSDRLFSFHFFLSTVGFGRLVFLC